MAFSIVEVKLGDKNYPRLLSKISDPPKKIYCRGNLDLFHTNCLAVVGTRKITSYGKEVAEKIVSGLSESGFTIVSGLALGIDAVAHRTALDYNMPTIAVLGSTIDDTGIGPRSNFPLAQEILNNGGLIISEYRNKDDIYRANFAIRDRIVSGLSLGVLVIEGAEKSGSLITARSAVDQNRDVFAVPGSIFSQTSAGTHWLIKNGAKLVTSAADILEDYDKNIKLDLSASNQISTRDPIQQKILVILDDKGELTTDEVIKESKLETSQVITALSMLELQNKIKQRSGKYSLCS